MRVLFLSNAKSGFLDSYTHRILQLKKGIEAYGAKTGIFYLGDLPFNTPSLIKPLNIPRTYRLMKGWDVIQGESTAATYVAGIAKILTHSVLVYDVHGNIAAESYFYRKNRFDPIGNLSILQAKFMDLVAKSASDYFVTVSRPIRQHLIDSGAKEERTEIIYNSVDTELFKPSKSRKEKGPFTVTYAGSFQKWQGIENLTEAALLLKDSNIQFRLIGLPDSSHALKETLKRKLGKKIELIDFIRPDNNGSPKKEFIDLLCSSDVLIIPRYYDFAVPKYRDPEAVRRAFGWLPTKFAEYIALGKPVIVSRLDESARFVEEHDCGFVFDYTAESIAEKILEAEKMPKQELDRKGLNGRRLAETEFDLRVVGRKHFEFLSRMLQNE